MKIKVVSMDTKWSGFKDSEDYLRPYFKVREFLSRRKDGSYYDVLLIYTELLDVLEYISKKLDEKYGKHIPIKVECCLRYPSHNKRVGGKSDSRHLVGGAIDINARGIKYKELRDLAVKGGAKYCYNIKKDGWSLHFDVMPDLCER